MVQNKKIIYKQEIKVHKSNKVVKTDSIFYRQFQEFPSVFFELIGNAPELASNYQFASVEIKQTAFRIDGVFLPTAGNENDIYFIEVQFQTDKEFYSRLFAEICLYLRQNKLQNNWSAVILYPSRYIHTGGIKHYREFFDSRRVRRIYLDEVGETTSLPIGIATVKLIIVTEDVALVEARQLIDRAKQEINSQLQQQQLLQFIETILVYKFPTISKKEIEAMFELSELKQTRFFQEVFQEGKQEGKQEGERIGKLKAVPPMLAAGLTIEQIAQALDLNVEEVRQVAQQ